MVLFKLEKSEMKVAEAGKAETWRILAFERPLSA